MEKKKYEKPEVEVIVIDDKDIVTDSVTVNWLDFDDLGEEVEDF